MEQSQKDRLKNAVGTAFNLLIEEFKDDCCGGSAASLARDDLKTVLAVIDGQPMADKKQGDGFTQTDLDNLADIIWWIKGYIAGAGENFEKCPFTEEHAESLRKARVALDLRREK